MVRIVVTEEDFDVGGELERLAGAGVGAVASFTGMVRGEAQGKRLVALTLEHYPGMTERALEEIAATAMGRWRLHDCLIVHRVGRLVPGSRIVLAAAASAHRSDALEATQFLIDWLKTDAPFWKREEFVDGTGNWVEARCTDQAARERWSL